MNFLAILLLFSNLGISPQKSGCGCKKAGNVEGTVSTPYVELDEQRVKKIEGQVLAYDDTPAEGFLVEVFTRPGLRRDRKQLRIAACITGEDGKFCFPGIRAGKYKLRISKREWEWAEGVMTVDPKKSRKDGAIAVHLRLAI